VSHRSPGIVVLAAVITSLALSGCGTFRLYSDVRDKQGAAAKKAWEEVDLKEIVTTERSNLDKLLEAELETQDRLAAGIRDYTLRNMVDSKTLDEGLVQRVDRRLNDLAGIRTTPPPTLGPRALLRQSLDQREQQRAAELSLAGTFAPDFERKNVQQPACSALAGGATPPAMTKWLVSANQLDAAEMGAVLKRMRANCLAAAAKPYASFGDPSELRTAWLQYEGDASQLALSRQAAAELQVT